MAPTDPALFDIAEDQLTVDMRSLGLTGLTRSSGIITEDTLPQLDGLRGMKVFKEMGEGDPLCASFLLAIDKLARSVSWRVESASGQPYDKAAADFVEDCLHDMRDPFQDSVSEFMSMAQYGFSAHELVYKRRMGKAPIFGASSKYWDGRIGWDGMPIRSQDSIYRWFFNKRGDIIGFEQQAAPGYAFVSIPIEKCLLFRTRSYKNNPLGLSVFRGAYSSWYYKRAIQRIEAIGIERDLAGLPVAGVPLELLAQGADATKRALLENIKNILRNVRNDEQGCIVFPLVYDENGKEMYQFKLMNSGGARQYNTSAIIERYDHRISAAMLFDFVLLGSSGGSSGSWAMHSDKTKLFIQVVNSFLDNIADQINRHAIPRLMDLNSFRMSDYPKIAHSGLEKTDLKELGTFVQALAASGVQLFPNADLENALLEAANLPKPLSYEAISQQSDVQPNAVAPPSKINEVREESDRDEPDAHSVGFKPALPTGSAQLALPLAGDK